MDSNIPIQSPVFSEQESLLKEGVTLNTNNVSATVKRVLANCKKRFNKLVDETSFEYPYN